MWHWPTTTVSESRREQKSLIWKQKRLLKRNGEETLKQLAAEKALAAEAKKQAKLRQKTQEQAKTSSR